MKRRFPVCLLLLYALISSPTAEGQTQCPITNVTFQVDPDEANNFIRTGDFYVLEGLTPGAVPMTVTWRRNGGTLSTIERRVALPGVSGAEYFIGGDRTSSTSCPSGSNDFRTAMQVFGRVTGEYTLIVDNAPTNTAVTRNLMIYDTGPVTGLTLTQVENRVQASWTAPANTGDYMEVVDYRVFIDNPDINGNGAIVPKENTTYTLPSPYDPGTTVTVRVRAASRNYWSTTTPMQQYTIIGVEVPMVVSTSTPTATSVTLTMSQPNTRPAISANQYIVTFTSNLCSGNIPTRVGTINGNSGTVGNLEADVTYRFSVIASNTNLGYNSSSSAETTIKLPESVPDGSPSPSRNGNPTATSISLIWTEIECIRRNGPIRYYIIQYGEGNNRNMTINATNATPLTQMFPNLSPYTNYTFTVAGATSVGTGPASDAIEIQTDEDEPTRVRNLVAFPGLISVSLTWDEPSPPNGVITRYDIMYSVNGSATVMNMSTTTNFKITGLKLNTNVSGISVTARTRIGPGPAVSISSVTTLERLPKIQNVTVMVLSDTSVRVSWNNPRVSSITYFLVSYSLVNNRRRQSDFMKQVNGADSTSTDITDLMTNKQYTFQVVAVAEINGVQLTGEQSAVQSLVVALPTTSPPPSGGSGSSAVPIAIGIVVAVLAVLVVIAFIIFLVWMHRTGRLSRLTGGSKSAPITSYRYAPSTMQPDNPYYDNNDTFAPLVEEFPDNTTAIEGEEVTFKVHVSGKPAPTLKWTCSGNEVSTNYAITVSSDGTLTFPSCEVDQSGVYELIAENSAGRAQREVKLQVDREAEDGVPDLSKQSLEIRAIPVDQFGEYVAGNHSNNNRGFRDQFQGLYDGEDKTKAIGLSPEYKKLNRFANITVYDDNRIELAPIPEHEGCDGPFINACYIDGFSKQKKFIASQGPIPRTLVDFWRMIWQERPSIIVMVTNLKEGNKNKCQQYWPDTGSTSFGPFKVMITENVVLADYVIRTLQVSLQGSNRPFKLTQFHFTAWPDHGVPDYATPMLAFHRRVISAHKGKKGPIMVHCSAGVGRTGTFISIDCILEQIKKEQVVDIAGTITRIRHQRMKMVQTPEQYVFLHDAILESVRCGDTQITAANLRVVMNKYGRKDQQTGLTTYQSQFDVLDQVSPKVNEVVCTAATRNQEKNRSMKYLPSDRFRVIIKGEQEDYIHASFAHGYKQQKAYIIAENPMAHTVPNFLKVLYNRKCGAVVMLSALEENGQEVCSRYWPNLNDMTKFGDYVVDLISEEVLSGFTMRNISILHEKTRKAHQVMQFHITCWQPDGQCTSLRSVVDTIEEIAKVQRKTGNKPIVVHCSDTVTRSGTFCALSTIIDRCKTEGVVDVFQVVKALRIQKPGAVPTVHDYQTIFEGTLTFLDSFDTYANFQS